MRTVVLGPPPAELEALIARRRTLGLDSHDEVWDGEYHLAPVAHSSHGRLAFQLARLLGPLADGADLVGTDAFNLGLPTNFRVPDLGLHRLPPNRVWIPTAAVVVEIESPDDETWAKLDFYAAHGVEEILIVSGERRSVTWLIIREGRYQESDRSDLLGDSSKDLAARIDWPEPPPT